MFDTILVPVALNPEKDESRLIAAAQRLKAEGGRLTLLHVLENIPHFVADRLPKDALREGLRRAENRLAALADSAGPEVAYNLVEGHGARKIVSEADRIQADCIVMGSHVLGMGDYLIGSTSAHVMRHARCSVLTVR